MASRLIWVFSALFVLQVGVGFAVPGSLAIFWGIATVVVAVSFIIAAVLGSLGRSEDSRLLDVAIRPGRREESLYLAGASLVAGFITVLLLRLQPWK